MTNYNERLDEILTKLENAVALNIGSQGMRGEAPKRSHWKAKQAITSLIKELVAEAEPINKQGEIDIDVPAYNDGYYSGANNALEKFKQNLLKALEEV